MKKDIQNVSSLMELKEVGKLLVAYNGKDKEKLIALYRAKRRELERAFVENSTNRLFKQCLYNINTMARHGAIAQTGKTIYEMAKFNFNKIEKDILFRAYRYQKSKALKTEQQNLF